MAIEVKLTYDSQHEAEEAMEQYKLEKGSKCVLSKLRDEMRQVCKYGEPTERDEFWYSRLFELCGEEGIDGWDV